MVIDFNKLSKRLQEKRKDINRLFLADSYGFIRIYKDNISSGETLYGVVRNIDLDRGEILDVFTKLEFLINEIMQLKLLGFNSEKSFMLDDLLVSADLYSRVKILEEWGIINRKVSNLIMQTKRVRNGFAHSWGNEEVYYKGERIESNFSKFKDDLEYVWLELLRTYYNLLMKNLRDPELNELVQKIKPQLKNKSQLDLVD